MWGQLAGDGENAQKEQAINFLFKCSQCKQPERDQERQQLRRELQFTRNHLSSLHLSSQDVPDSVAEVEVSSGIVINEND